MVEQQAAKIQRQTLENQHQALEIQLLRLGRGEVPYASPSTDYDDGDRTKQANGARCALDYFGAPFLAEKIPLSANEKRFLEFTGTLDPQRGLPFSRRCTVVEIIHIVSQQSNAF